MLKRWSYCWSEVHLDVLWHHAALLTRNAGRQDPDGGPWPPEEPRPEEIAVLVEDKAERDVCRPLATIGSFCKRHKRQKTTTLFEAEKKHGGTKCCSDHVWNILCCVEFL